MDRTEHGTAEVAGKFRLVENECSGLYSRAWVCGLRVALFWTIWIQFIQMHMRLLCLSHKKSINIPGRWPSTAKTCGNYCVPWPKPVCQSNNNGFFYSKARLRGFCGLHTLRLLYGHHIHFCMYCSKKVQC